MTDYDAMIEEIMKRHQTGGASGSGLPNGADFGSPAGYVSVYKPSPPDESDDDLERMAQGLSPGEKPKPSFEKALALQRLNPPKPGDWLGDPSDPNEIKKMLEAQAEKAAEAKPRSKEEIMLQMTKDREDIKAAHDKKVAYANKLIERKPGMTPAQIKEEMDGLKDWEKRIEKARTDQNKVLDELKGKNFNVGAAVKAADLKIDQPGILGTSIMAPGAKTGLQWAASKIGGAILGTPAEDTRTALDDFSPLDTTMDAIAAPQRAVMGTAAFVKEALTGGDAIKLLDNARIDEKGNDRGFFGGLAEMGKSANESAWDLVHEKFTRPIVTPALDWLAEQDPLIKGGAVLGATVLGGTLGGAVLGGGMFLRGNADNPHEFDRGATHLVGELATDPLSYIGPGALLRLGGSLAKAGPYARKAAQLASKLEAASEILKPLGLGDDVIRGIAKSDDLVGSLMHGLEGMGKSGDELGDIAHLVDDIDAKTLSIGKVMETLPPKEFIDRVRPSLEALDTLDAAGDVRRLQKAAKKNPQAKTLLPQDSLAKQVDMGQRSELWKPLVAAWRGVSGPAGEIMGALESTKLGRPVGNAIRGLEDAFSRAFITDIPLYRRDPSGKLLRDADGVIVKNTAMQQAAAAAELIRQNRVYGIMKFAEDAKARHVEDLNALPEIMRNDARRNVAKAIEVIPGQERLKMISGETKINVDDELPPFAPAPGMPADPAPNTIVNPDTGYITKAGLDKFPGYEKEFLKYAHGYANDLEFLRQLERANGLPTSELVDDVLEGYYGRVWSQRFGATVVRNPSVAEILRNGREDYLQASGVGSGGSFMKERKLKGFSLEEADAFIRQKLKDGGHNLPDDIDIFERDAAEAFDKRAQASARAVDRSTSMEAISNKIAEAHLGQAEYVDDVSGMKKTRYDEAYDRYVKNENDAKLNADAADEFRYGKEKVGAAASVQETQLDKIAETLSKIETERSYIASSRKGQTLAKEVAQEKAYVAKFYGDYKEAKRVLYTNPAFAAAKKNYKRLDKLVEEAEANMATAVKIGTPKALAHAMALLEEATSEARKARKLANTLPGFKETQAVFAGAFKRLHESYVVASEIERGILRKQIFGLAKKAGKDLEDGKVFAEILKPIEKAADKMFYLDEAGKISFTDDVRAMRDALQKMRIKMRDLAPAYYKNEKAAALAHAKKQGERLDTAQEALGHPKIASTLNAKKRTSKRAAQESHPVHIDQQSSQAKAAFVRSALKDLGHSVPAGKKSMLEVYEKTNVRLPASVEDITKLETSYISNQDFKAITDLHTFAMESGPFWKAYDETKRFFQRAVLSSPLSAIADTAGTQANYALITNGDVTSAAAALAELSAVKKSDDILFLASHGALDTATSVERSKNILAVASEEGLLGPTLGKAANAVHSKGFAGAAFSLLSKKLGKAATWTADMILEAREVQEKAARLATFKHYLKKGYSRADAAQEVIKWWPKFQQLTKMERSTLNRFMFFYSFTKKSLAPAVRMVLERPLQARYLMALTAGNVRDQDTSEKWQREQGGTVIIDKDGRSKLRSLPGSWFGTFYGIMQAAESGKTYDRGTGGGLFGAASGYLAAKLAPVPRALVEMLTQRSVSTGKKIAWAPSDSNYDRHDRLPATIGVVLDLLGTGAVEPVNVKGSSEIDYYRAKGPLWAWLLDTAFPGIKGTTRITDAILPGEGQDRRLEKLGAAAVGLKISDIDTSKQRRLELELRGASNQLAESVSRLPGEPLAFEHGRLEFNPRSAKGQKLKGLWDAEKANILGAGIGAPDKIQWLHNQGETDAALMWHLANTIAFSREMVADGGKPGDTTFGKIGVNLSAGEKLAAPEKFEELLDMPGLEYKRQAREKARAKKLANKIR